MDKYYQTYQEWLFNDKLEVDLKQELLHMKEYKVKDAFHKDLDFGTGGMRGLIGVGTNRLNIYTVRKVATGIAFYMDKYSNQHKKSIVISYDSRHKSREFAENMALVLANHDIKVYLFQKEQPTPLLSFAVREKKASMGIMITASHNPSEYNGIKVYNQEGAQLNLEESNNLIELINDIDNVFNIALISKEKAITDDLLSFIEEDMEDTYLTAVSPILTKQEMIKENGNSLSIVYSPLHGTSKDLLTKGFHKFGFTNSYIVEEQANPDPNFSTVTYPNPEEKQSFDLLMQYGEKYNADMLLATDPDADRLGVVVKNNLGNYQFITGNQMGALLTYYLLSTNQLPKDKKYFMFKTIVTSDLGEKIANDYGVQVVNTLSGFKFIAEHINQFTSDEQLLIGYEDSFGFLLSDVVRDKDAIQSALLISEMALYYKRLGKTLYEVLQDLYKEYGYYKELTISKTFYSNFEDVDKIMDNLRSQYILILEGLTLTAVEDYVVSKRHLVSNNVVEEINLPTSNVIKYTFNDNSWVTFRPSGTEPKFKAYISVNADTEETLQEKLRVLKQFVLQVIHYSDF